VDGTTGADSRALALQVDGGTLSVRLGGRELIRHSAAEPALFVGHGRTDIRMNRGNFHVADRLDERVALRSVHADGERILFRADAGARPLLSVRADGGSLRFEALDPSLNRFWLRVRAAARSAVWGAGEQMSYLNLRGRRFPLWTSEPGIGRDKTTRITWEADRLGGAGGDDWWTNYPQPTFLSEEGYALHVETSAYAVFDFRDPGFHEVEVWDVPAEVALLAGTPRELVGALSKRFGCPPPLPRWAYEGAIIGLKDGANSLTRLEAIEAAGARVGALWCEDWCGVRQTSFGRRLFWDWRASEARYPALRQRIAELADRNVRFLGYVNPYLAIDGSLYPEALHAGYLALSEDGSAPAHVDFGEFDAAIVDFTNPEASIWFAERVIGREMLDFGLSGWMADFGEYLPTNVRLWSGEPATLAHNRWPVLWAEVNARAVASRGRTGDAVFFMRAGWTGVQRHCPLLWAGDQSVDFSRHDGLETAIRAALSAGLVGNPYHHSDIGGYTSLFGLTRTPELLMRWAEHAAFTPVMRTHEGNRPQDNLQVDSTPELLAHFGRMTRVHAALAPYTAALVAEAQATGLPLMRPTFLHDPAAGGAPETQYLYGGDLLVAPVVAPGVSAWEAVLPAGEWVHLWSGQRFGAGPARITAPFGQPPVFWREGSPHSALFESASAA
jgi:alpha-glucosidase